MAISWGAVALAGAGFGLDFFGKKSAADNQHKLQLEQYKQEQLAVAQRNAQAVAARNAENLRIRAQNDYAVQAFGTRIGIAKQQIGLNNEAAQRAFLGAELNRNRQLTALAFQREDLAAELLEAVGANNAAIEGDNRSARLAAAKRTYGRFGRMDAQADMQVQGINEDVRLKFSDIHGQRKAANLQSYSQVAIAPYLQQELGPAAMLSGPSRPSGPSGLSTALMIGSGLLGAASTYNSLAAPQDKIFSFGSGSNNAPGITPREVYA